MSYWISGSGKWLNRWEATGHDYLLFSTMITLNLVFLILLTYYVYQSYKATKLLEDSYHRDQAKQLSLVFILIGLMNLTSKVLAWWIPLWWIDQALTFSAILFTMNLLFIKSHPLTTQELKKGEDAVSLVREVTHIVKTQELGQSAAHTLYQIEQKLKSLRT